MADFDGDNVPDLVTSGANSVSVMLGNGSGGAKSLTDYPLGTTATFIASGDFDGDGKVDLLLVTGPGIIVLPGKGDGSFKPKVETKLGFFIVSTAVGDFDGDKKLDLVTADFVEGYVQSVTVRSNQGDGTFVPTFSVPVIGNSDLRSGDFDGDGKLDFATVTSSDSLVSVYLNKGMNSFAPKVDYAIGSGFFGKAFFKVSIVPGDFNGDGKLDLAFAGYTDSGGPSLGILLNAGAGTFPKVDASYPIGPFISPGADGSLHTTDFDGDGKTDIVSDSTYPLLNENVVSVLIGEGNGTFLKSIEFPVAGDVNPRGLAAGDVDGDGRVDLALPAFTSVSVLFNGTCLP